MYVTSADRDSQSQICSTLQEHTYDSLLLTHTLTLTHRYTHPEYTHTCSPHASLMRGRWTQSHAESCTHRDIHSYSQSQRRQTDKQTQSLDTRDKPLPQSPMNTATHSPPSQSAFRIKNHKEPQQTDTTIVNPCPYTAHKRRLCYWSLHSYHGIYILTNQFRCYVVGYSSGQKQPNLHQKQMSP